MDNRMNEAQFRLILCEFAKVSAELSALNTQIHSILRDQQRSIVNLTDKIDRLTQSVERACR